MRLINDSDLKSLMAEGLETKIVRSAYAMINNLNDPLRANLLTLPVF